MLRIFHRFVGYVRQTVWAVIIAYMLGLHNIYRGEEKTPDNIVITIEENEQQEDGTPKD